MAATQMNVSDVFVGRIQEFCIHQSGSIAVHRNKLKSGTVSIKEEIKRDIESIEDGQEISEYFGRKVIAELTISELVQGDIAKMDQGDYFYVRTETGGTGTGLKIEISGSDYMVAQIEGNKTKVTVEKSVATGFPYTISEPTASTG